jgi:GGDEF domain-containing protein
MLWYFAIVAALNLGLGYAWAVFFRPCPRCARARAMRASWPTAETRDVVARPMAASAAPASAAAAPVAEVEKTAEAEVGAAPCEESFAAPDHNEMPRDPSTGLATRDYAETLLAELAKSGAHAGPFTVALVEMAKTQPNGGAPDEALDERVLCGVANVVRQALADNQTAARYTDQQLLLIVPREDVRQATRRAEEFRQRIASTQFVADGRSVQTTVTCALVEVTSNCGGPKLFEFLQEALDEAKRYGGNRTFMHDGNSPTPVVPPELSVSPQQLAI